MALNLGPLNVMLRLQGAQRFTRDARGAESALVGFGKAVGGALVLQQLARQVVEATKVFAEFDRAMVRVGAVTNSLGTEAFAGLTERAKDLATTTEFTARQVADAMGFMGMAGMDVNNIYESTPAVLQLASAGMVDVASAADTVTNIMAGYGIEAKDLTKANNVLVATFTGSNTSLQSLGQSFKYAGSVAKNAGVEFKEAAAVIGLMGNAGIQADMAGTALRGAIIKLLKPSAEGAEVMRRYGIEVKDSTGKLKSMVEIFRELEPIADDSALMVDLFGLRAGPGLQAALSQGSGALEKLIDKIDNAGDIAERIAKAQMETLDGKIKVMKSNFEGLQIAIGKAFEPATITSVETLSGKLAQLSLVVREIGEAFRDLSSAESRESILNLGAALNPLIAALRAARNAYSDAFPEEIGKVYGPDTQSKIEYMVGAIRRAREQLEKAEAGFLAGENNYEKVQQAAEALDQYQQKVKSLRKELQLAALAQETGMSLIPDYSGMTIGKPAMPPEPAKTPTGKGLAGLLEGDAGLDAVRELFRDMPVFVSEFEMSLDEFDDFMDSFGFASEVVIEHNQAIEKATEAALDSAQGFQQTASVIGSILQAARSGTLFGTVGGMAGGAAGSAISMAAGDPTGMIGGTIGGVIGEFFGSIADSISGALPALIVTLIVGSVLSVLTLLFAQVLIPLVAPLAVLAGVATLAATQLWDLASQTEAMAEGERILAAAHGLLVEAIDPVVRAFLPLAVVIYEVIAPLAATFGVLLYNLGLFADVAELLFGAFKLLGTAALSIAEFLAGGDEEEQARLRAAREELLDLTYSEAQARAAAILASVDATEAVREFSEELRNVPIGVKRIRALQFSAAAGRFNSPAWGA